MGERKKRVILAIAIVGVVFLIGISSQATAAMVTATGPGGAIPDNNSTGFSSIATITDDLLITDLSIIISGFTHTWVGDLVVTLTAPDGSTSADIMRRTGPGIGGSPNDLDGNYTFADGGADWWSAAVNNNPIPSGTYAASTDNGVFVSLATTFGGLSSLGDWTLNISDLAGLNAGAFTGWEIKATVVPVPAAVWLLGGGLIALWGLRRRLKN